MESNFKIFFNLKIKKYVLKKHLVDMLPYFLFSLHHPRLGISHLLSSLLPLSQNHAIQSIPCILTHHLLDAQWPLE